MRRTFRLDAGLGDEIEWMGNPVRPILTEIVDQEWRNGELVSETREIHTTSKVALVIAARGAARDLHDAMTGGAR